MPEVTRQDVEAEGLYHEEVGKIADGVDADIGDGAVTTTARAKANLVAAVESSKYTHEDARILDVLRHAKYRELVRNFACILMRLEAAELLESFGEHYKRLVVTERKGG